MSTISIENPPVVTARVEGSHYTFEPYTEDEYQDGPKGERVCVSGPDKYHDGPLFKIPDELRLVVKRTVFTAVVFNQVGERITTVEATEIGEDDAGLTVTRDGAIVAKFKPDSYGGFVSD